MPEWDTRETAERYLQAIYLTCVCVVALLGNISLWIVILSNRQLRDPSNTLILCLSFADILVSAVNMPVIVYTILVGSWMFSDSACVVLGFITMLTFVTSVMSLGSISINRYFHICHPSKSRIIYTTRNTAFIILGTWMFSALLSMPPLVGWSEYGYLDTQSFCFCDWKTSISYTFFMVGMCFGGPCSAMTFCYVKILLKVRHSKRKLSVATHGRGNRGYDSTDTDEPTEHLRNKDTETQINNQSVCPSDVYMGVEVDHSKDRRSSRISRSSTKSRKKRPSSGLEVRSWTTDDMLDGSYLSDGRGASYPGRLHNVGMSFGHHVDNNYTVHSLEASFAAVHPAPSNGEDSGFSQDTVGGAAMNDAVSDISGNLCTTECFPRSNAKTYDVSRRSSVVMQETDNRGRYSRDNRRSTDGEIISHPSISPDTPGLSEKAGTSTETPAKRSGSLDIGSHLRAITRRLRSPSIKSKTKSRSGINEMRLIKMFLVVIMMFVICWLPFCVTMFYYVFNGTPAPRTIDMLTILLGCTNSACNPIIYGLMNKKYKQGYVRLYCCLCNRVRARDPVSMSQTAST